MQEDSQAESEADDKAADQVSAGKAAMAGKSEEKKGGGGDGEAPGVEDGARGELAADAGDVEGGVVESFFEDGGGDLHSWKRKAPKEAAEDEDGDGEGDAGACRALRLQ